MLTVTQAALRVGRSPETIRRWIRSGRLRAEETGTSRFLIDEAELRLAQMGRPMSFPEERRSFPDGTPTPSWVQIIRRSRNKRAASIRWNLRDVLRSDRGAAQR